MAATLLRRHRKGIWLGWGLGAALAVLVGEALLLPLGDGLARLSYDLPFLFSRTRVPDDLAMVYLDPRIKQNLGQPTDQPLDRRFYVRLLQRLKREGARLVFFDILFDNPSPAEVVDAQFAEAIRTHGRVVLVGYKIKEFQGNNVMTVPVPPITVLKEAAKGWGFAEISQDPADNSVRLLERGTEEFPAGGWVAASLLDPGTITDPEHRQRWLNYVCRPTDLKAVNLDHALSDGLPSEYFRDKIVVVGNRPGTGGIAGAERDEFATPYSRFHGPLSSGASIHAFTMLNLLHRNWLTRLDLWQEAVLVLCWGCLITAILLRFHPWLALIAGFGCFVVFGLGALFVHTNYHVWFGWMVPAAAQTAIAVIWSVGYQYVTEFRKRQRYRRAFAIHLSPYMADRIAESEYDLSLGGREVDATIMFTDLEGFTQMTEALPPTEVSKLLIAYFTETTQAILDQQGTIIKYIGDSVMAVWGAPMADPMPAERAVVAALGMRKSGEKEFEGRRLRTRIGINSGKVLAGNLGSEFRADYTCIGEATNFASRLEGLNKYLGTDVLISATTRRELSEKIQLRYLGRFVVAGKSVPVGVYEALGLASEFQPAPEWLEAFARGLDSFTERNLDGAEKQMRRVLELRSGKDGPASFYLQEISKARTRTEDTKPWDGAVILDAK
jgi:adenylate cyclase